MKKSQAGIEFLYFVGVAIVILSIYLILSSNYLDFTYARKDILSTQNLLEEARNKINLAGRVENGYSMKITLPDNVNNKNYTINLAEREIYISIDGNEYGKLLSTDINTITLIPGASYIIKKDNNDVTVTAA